MGFGNKSARNLLSSIEGSKATTLSRFLYALGISHVGTFTADLLANSFGTFEALRSAPAAQLQQIQGIGEKIAVAVTTYFSNPENDRLIEDLLALGIVIENPERQRPAQGGFWQGKTVVFTGVLSSMSRQEAGGKAAAKGARVTESVSKKTDMVVAGADPGSKVGQGREVGDTDNERG